MASNERQPIFKPMRSEFRVMNLSAAAAVVVAAVLLSGAGITALLGGVTRTVVVPYAQYQVAAMTQEYESMSVRLASAEMAGQEPDAQLAARAAEAGVKAGMGRYEIEALVPRSYTEEVEAIPMAARILFLVVIPTTAAYVLLFESSRTTMLKELRRIRRLKRSQKTYKTDAAEFSARVEARKVES